MAKKKKQNSKRYIQADKKEKTKNQKKFIIRLTVGWYERKREHRAMLVDRVRKFAIHTIYDIIIEEAAKQKTKNQFQSETENECAE